MKRLLLLLFTVVILFSQEERDLTCQNQFFCQDENSVFLCEFYCPEIHNRIIPSCDDCNDNVFKDLNNENDIDE